MKLDTSAAVAVDKELARIQKFVLSAQAPLTTLPEENRNKQAATAMVQPMHAQLIGRALLPDMGRTATTEATSTLGEETEAASRPKRDYRPSIHQKGNNKQQEQRTSNRHLSEVSHPTLKKKKKKKKKIVGKEEVTHTCTMTV